MQNRKSAYQKGKRMQIKICGLTRPKEAQYLNAAGADYAGFVFHPPSRRNVTIEEAKVIMEALNPGIKKVAVMVSPEVATVEMVQKAGFDILQIHGTLSNEVLELAELPIWFAVNLSKTEELTERLSGIRTLPEALAEKIDGFVMDGAQYGSGKTFAWDVNAKQTVRRWRSQKEFTERKLILAGGLRAENVQEGIRLFDPDVVDVSSGVEDEGAKSMDKIMTFIREVSDYE